MAKIYNSISELVGHTPVVELKNIEKKFGLKGKIFAKLEYFNPAGSVKDRVALNMILNAERDGKISKGGVLIEPTSGNTGIGIAAIGVPRGYRVIIVMPETMSVERRKLIKAYGAEIVLSDGSKGMKGAIEKAEELANETGGTIMGQFVNPSNPEAHYKTTGVEIYEDMDGAVDYFVAGVGTGGTITGAGKYLKEKKADVKVVAVEPYSSPVISEGRAGKHGIQGIGAGFIPETLDISVIDEVIAVKDEDAFNLGKTVSGAEGFLVGISSGAALWAATEVAKREESKGKNIVVILPDSGDRYLSTTMFD